MAAHTDGQLALIHQLIAEKDRLVAEKDELIVSKDKLWREMYQMVRERDAKIEQLEHGDRMLSRPHGTDEHWLPGSLDDFKQENNTLLERNRALEEALRDLLDREEDAEDGEESASDERDGETGPLMGVKGEQPDEKYQPSAFPNCDPAGPGRHLVPLSAQPKAFLPSPSSKDRSSEPPTLPVFSFAPLITMSDEGMYETGNIGAAAPAVLQSIRSQLAELEKRVKDGKRPTAPASYYQSTGCLWQWMTKSTTDTRWTSLSPREFACAACFNSRRACLLWLGNMRYIILPLPPAARKVEAMWEDAEYYIHQGADNVKDQNFPGVWEASRKKR